MEKEKSYAVHEGDLEEFLKDLEIFDEVQKGNAICFICKKKVSLKNLQCVFPMKGEIGICCQNLNCFQKVMEYRRGNKK